MYNSIDRAMEKIEKQVRRYRDKLIKLRPKDGVKMKMRFKLLEAAQDVDLETAPDLPPTIIETKEFQARPMLLDEAVMQMDLLHNDVLVFLNAKTDQVNVLYRKKSNKYGLIEANVNG
jgi:putative sigma-54 modulation protein